MNNKTLISSTLLAVSILSLNAQQRVVKAHPNVIIILADDIGYGDLSCYGETTIHTPNVDKLIVSRTARR